jgi:flagellum-specific peptidoglycan hydrolase FlgJ
MRLMATDASRRTGLPVSFILAQWAHETGHGTSSLSRAHRNQGGIEFTGQPGSYNADGRHAGYDSDQAFLQDYVRVINLSYYDKVRATAQQPGATSESVAVAMGASGYAEDPDYGKKLVSLLRSAALSLYDRPAEPSPGLQATFPAVSVEETAEGLLVKPQGGGAVAPLLLLMAGVLAVLLVSRK